MVIRASKLASLPVALPSNPLPANLDITAVATQFANLGSRLADPQTYTPDAVWRDIFALTGTLRTFYSADGIVQALQESSKASASIVKDSLVVLPQTVRRNDLVDGTGWVEVSGLFEIRTRAGIAGRCKVLLGVVPAQSGDSWKVWQMRTILDHIVHWPKPILSPSSKTTATSNGTSKAHINGNGEQSPNSNNQDWFDVVVVGGGQSGLSAAGYLQALNLNYILIDKYDQVGDSWGTRYDSARLHTSRDSSYLPFHCTFPESEYPEYLSKDDLARGFRNWTDEFDIDKNIWLKTELVSGSWDDSSQKWTLNLRKDGTDCNIGSRFVVMAAGAAGQIPVIPDIPDKELFQGVSVHSKMYKNAKGWKGKGIVVGAGNTAHDVAEDMLLAGLETTIVQRSPVYVLPTEYWQKVGGQIYNKHIPIEVSDMIINSGPNAVGRLVLNMAMHALAATEPERFDALTRAGFANERFIDLSYILHERGGGHFMDVGTGQHIADGRIKVESRKIVKYTKSGLMMEDGTEVPADVIVWATGFQVNLRDSIAQILGKDVAARIDDFWGLDDEGEIRGAWRLQHPGLITHGVAFGQARFFSKYIAYQIRAVLEGKAFEPYLDTPIPPKKLDSAGS